MPAWRMPPPYILRSLRQRLMKSLRPAISEPAGAPRPLDRQALIESKPCTMSRSEAPHATAAFQIRAPAVLILAEDDLVAVVAVGAQRDLVGHRAGRHEQRRLGAEQLCDPVLQL